MREVASHRVRRYISYVIMRYTVTRKLMLTMTTMGSVPDMPIQIPFAAAANPPAGAGVASAVDGFVDALVAAAHRMLFRGSVGGRCSKPARSIRDAGTVEVRRIQRIVPKLPGRINTKSNRFVNS